MLSFIIPALLWVNKEPPGNIANSGLSIVVRDDILADSQSWFSKHTRTDT